MIPTMSEPAPPRDGDHRLSAERTQTALAEIGRGMESRRAIAAPNATHAPMFR